MDVSIDRKQRVAKYFIAWKEYDMDLLRDIFFSTAKYVIRGKRTYYGIEEIVQYWERNKKRQKDIQLYWKILNTSFHCEIVEFGAYFWDLEEEVYTKINGQIIFKYNSKNQIIKLTEAYKKRTTK